jgi:hypothetical protein
MPLNRAKDTREMKPITIPKRMAKARMTPRNVLSLTSKIVNMISRRNNIFTKVEAVAFTRDDFRSNFDLF